MSSQPKKKKSKKSATRKNTKKIQAEIPDYPDINLKTTHDAVILKLNTGESIYCFVQRHIMELSESARKKVPIIVYYPSVFNYGPIMDKSGRKIAGFGMKVFPWIPGIKRQWMILESSQIFGIYDMDDSTVDEFAQIVKNYCDNKMAEDNAEEHDPVGPTGKQNSEKISQKIRDGVSSGQLSVFPYKMMESFDEVMREVGIDVRNDEDAKEGPGKTKDPGKKPKPQPPKDDTDTKES